MPIAERLLKPIADVHRGEAATAWMMFAYSFLAMTAYNIVQPITRSRFITSLGADNLPYVLLVSAFIVGVIMQGYSRLGSLVPGRWVIPITQAGMVGLLVLFWTLFAAGQQWVDVAFYLFGQMYGILLISQFWTLANLIYDPRQAKRLFGFIGGGSTAGGALGASIAAFLAEEVGSRQLVLVSAVTLALCAGLVILIVRRSASVELRGLESAAKEKGVGGAEALRMLRESKHLQVIALTIALMSIGAGIIDQQLNMAAEGAKGRGATDAITEVLGQVQVYVSVIGFFIQVWLTSRIHRLLGVGFALLILPIGLGSSAIVILLNGALWAPMFARVLDKSLRYTVDKTSREVLFLPLPPALKQKAKPFVDVTVDRVARAAAAFLLLLLIKPWGLHLTWQQVSFASLVVMALWIVAAIRAKRGYVAAFRRSMEQGLVRPEELRLSGADLTTIETLVQELSHPDANRVVYAIDVLESLDKRHLVTPLLLYHESPRVRVRALSALGQIRADIARQWVPQIRRLLGDDDPAVRAAALGALAAIENEDVATLVRPMLDDPDPRIRVTAAVALARSQRPEDRDRAGTVFAELTGDTTEASRPARRDAAVALRQIRDTELRLMLMPLLYDPAPEVAEEALTSVGEIGHADALFVPALMTLLRNRRLKGAAREVLVSYGPPVVKTLAYVLADKDEDIWIRRHIPSTLARIPTQESVDALITALGDPDGFLRYKAVAALQTLRREHDELVFRDDRIEATALAESRRYFTHLSLYHNLFERGGLPRDTMLAQVLTEKTQRALNRMYLLLGLLYPWKDIAAARWTLEHGDSRSRATASEYLDNILTGQIRKRVMPALEDLPREEKVRRGNVLLRTRPRDVEESLLQLINDEDEVAAAAAIELVAAEKRWSLADDIEHVLAHRDVRDWFVFEAASWALAERRVSAERRRELWREPLPAAALAERLRLLPLFGSVSIDELFRIAGAGRQVRHDPGTVLLQEGMVPAVVHFVLDGRVVVTDQNAPPATLSAPAALGLEEALQGIPSATGARAIDLAVTLAIPVDELRILLADNSDLVRGLFVTLANASDAYPFVSSTGAAAEFEQIAAAGLTPVEKVLALQRVPLFSRLDAADVRALAGIARRIDIAAGAKLFEASTPPALWIILSGEVAVSIEGRSRMSAASGTELGMSTLLKGGTMGASAEGVRAGIALRVDRDDLFDLVEQRPTLLQRLFVALFRRVTPEAAAVLQQ